MYTCRCAGVCRLFGPTNTMHSYELMCNVVKARKGNSSPRRKREHLYVYVYVYAYAYVYVCMHVCIYAYVYVHVYVYV